MRKIVSLSVIQSVQILQRSVDSARQEILALQEQNRLLQQQVEANGNQGRMTIQTLSIDVPGKSEKRIAPCPNSCFFCVSQLHDNPYDNLIGNPKAHGLDRKPLFIRAYRDRMAFARDNDSNTMIFTGTGEPAVNEDFLERVATWNRGLSKPFRSIELQTSGVTVDKEKLGWLFSTVNVTTISLSLSSIWSNEQNADYNQTVPGKEIDIDGLAAQILKWGFSLRLSLNLTDFYNGRSPEEIFARAQELGAHQLTFRVLYESDTVNTDKERTVNQWIQEHRADSEVIQQVHQYVLDQGRALERLPFGPMRYSVGGLSTVVDDDCMSTGVKPTLKYLILRPNCKLYTKWEDPGSLLF